MNYANISFFKIKLVLPVFLIFISFFSFTAVFYISSYCLGTSSDVVNRYDRLLLLDSLEKKQPSANYTHSLMISPDGTTISDLLSIQAHSKESKFRRYVPSYCIAGVGESPQKFELRSESEVLIASSVTCVTVSTFSDTNVMESLPLGLYRNIGLSVYGHGGAEYGSYISSTQADSIIASDPLFTTYDDLIDKPYVFTMSGIGSSNTISTFSVNNIYFDSKSDLWDKSEQIKYDNLYNNYYNCFKNCNGNAIITASYAPFTKYGALFEFDLRNGFGTARDYISQVIGYDYASKGFSLRFSLQNESGEGFQPWFGLDNLDIYCVSASPVEGLWWWLLPLVAVFFIASCYICLVIKNWLMIKTRKWFLFYFLFSVGPFVLYQLANYFVWMAVGTVLPALLFFNPVGNLSTLVLAMVVALLPLYKPKKETNDTGL